jgi:ketosteroid isomerase-like protein
MSEQNVEIVRRHLAAYLDVDPERALEFLDEAVELDATVRPDGRVYSGRDGIRRAMTEWTGAWAHWEVEIERVLDAGEDKVLYLWHERGSGKGSGVPMDQTGATVVTVRAGRIVHLRAYVDRAAAYAAAGLAEH